MKKKERINPDTLYISKEYIGLQCYSVIFDSFEKKELYKNLLKKTFEFQEMEDLEFFILEIQAIGYYERLKDNYTYNKNN
jgi:hypothetical protein